MLSVSELGSGLCPHRQVVRAGASVGAPVSVAQIGDSRLVLSWMSVLGLGWLWMKRHDPRVLVALTVDRGQDACLVRGVC